MRCVFDVGFIQWLQQFSSPALDRFFLLVTNLGSHYAYMAILPFVFWAVDRQVGRRLAGLILGTMWLNGLVKEHMVMPRPHPADVRVLGFEPSPGFPSGHAQGALTLWGYLAFALRRRWLTWLAVVLILLISLSRLYLGVHFPGDVLGGWAIAAVVLVAVHVLAELQLFAALSVRLRMLLIFLVPLLLYPLYQTSTSEQLIGFFIGFFTAETLSAEMVPFRARVGFFQQVVKLIIGYLGFAALVALHMMFVPPGLPAVLGYSIIGIWLSIGAPALFRRLGLAGEGAFGRRVDARMHGYMRHYMATALVVVLLVAGSTLYVRSAVPMGTRPAVLPEADVLVIGHRGAAGLAPENTLPSIAAALEYNAHVVEVDLWPSREGIPVVLHDETVDRTTNGTGRVTDMTVAELKALDAGYHFTEDGVTYPWRGRGVTIPTLEEMLREFPDTVFLLEIKYPEPDFVNTVLEVVDAAGARGRVLIESFHDAVVQRAREAAPDVPTSYGQGELIRFALAQRLGVGAFVRPVGDILAMPEWYSGIRVVNPGLARLARKKGIQLHVWTINDEDSMIRIIGLGADAVITDYPDRLQRVLALLEEHSTEDVFY